MNIAVSATRTKSLSTRSIVRTVIVGHVDHGKSTLIGRLLHETGNLPDGKLEHLEAVSARRGIDFEWSFLLDALQTERDQGITIDTSQIRFRTPSRDIVLIDAPGHTEFLRNMITGAAQADAAILVVDAAEGIRDQTRRHGYLLHLLGIRQVAVVINKMDRVGYSRARFEEIRAEIAALGLKPVAVIPIDWPAPAPLTGGRPSGAGQDSIDLTFAVLLPGITTISSPTESFPVSIRPAMMR
jgi:bifunctional enzyme CysN/CysC